MRIGRIIMGLAVFATALAVGFSLARPLAPEPQRDELLEPTMHRRAVSRVLLH